jgi:hypothetical protein
MPAGGTVVSGAGTRNITASFNAGISGNITVRAVNSCGTSTSRTLAISTVGCPPPLAPNNGNQTAFEGMGLTEDLNVSTYPNPFDQKVSVKIETGKFKEVAFELYNMSGQRFEQSNFRIVEGQLDLELTTDHLSSGMYFIQLKFDGELTRTYKIVKN